MEEIKQELKEINTIPFPVVLPRTHDKVSTQQENSYESSSEEPYLRQSGQSLANQSQGEDIFITIPEASEPSDVPSLIDRLDVFLSEDILANSSPNPSQEIPSTEKQ